jgi:hypothetical protein
VDNPQHEWVSLVTSRQGAWERAGTIGHVSAASSNRLGDFLRASRARLDPADAGLIGGGSRRVPGLRREEVAVIAEAIGYAIGQPGDVDVNELVIRPTVQA